MKSPVFWCEVKYIFHMRMLFVWSLLLPIVLATLFSLTLSDVYGSKKTDKIKVGIVFQSGYEEEQSHYSANDELFTTYILDEKLAEEYLKNGMIEGYAYIGDTCRLIVLDNGYEQMIIKNSLDEYMQMRAADESVRNNYIYLENSTAGMHIEKRETQIYSAISHYDTILAMACICAVFAGILIVSSVRHPDYSAAALRFMTAPHRLFQVIVQRFLAAWILQTLLITISFLYMQFVLQIPFHMDLRFVILIQAIGILVSMMTGVMIGFGNRLRQQGKIGITSAVIIVCAYFSGLMDIHVRATIQEHFPFMRFINPCMLISDAYYALYQSDYLTVGQNMAAILAIGLFSILLIVLYTGEDRHAVI